MMTGRLDPAVARGRLQRRLREARVHAGLSQLDAAAELDWSSSKLIRIESGLVRLSRADLFALLAVYGVKDRAVAGELVELARAGRQQTWREYRDILPPRFITYLGYESSATDLQVFDPTFVPQLLHTADYARHHIETLAAPGTTDEVRCRLLEVRLARQARLHYEGGPAAHFLIDETVLHRGIGGPDNAMMRDQLRSLASTAHHTNITIQIIPVTAGLYPGLAGSFALLSSPEDPDSDLLYVDRDWTSIYGAEHTERLHNYRNLFTTLTRRALAPDHSAKLLDTLATDAPTSHMLTSERQHPAPHRRRRPTNPTFVEPRPDDGADAADSPHPPQVALPMPKPASGVS